MYNVYDAAGEKMFGCSSLLAVIEYISEIGVTTVVTGTKALINLANGEYIEVSFGCPTAAHEWISRHVPGKLVKIVSRKSGSEYLYEKEQL